MSLVWEGFLYVVLWVLLRYEHIRRRHRGPFRRCESCAAVLD